MTGAGEDTVLSREITPNIQASRIKGN